jgi:hypothetical protein
LPRICSPLIYVDLLSLPPANGTVEPNAVVNSRRLYRSCVDETGIESDGVEPILSVLENEFGGWPILQGSSWNSSMFDLMTLLLNLRKYSNNLIYQVGTSIDEKNSTTYDIEVSINGESKSLYDAQL